MLTLKRRGIYLALTSFVFVFATLFSPLTPHIYADTPKSVDFNDKSLVFNRINRTLIDLGGAWFYSTDPTGDNNIYNSVGLTCPAVLTYSPMTTIGGGEGGAATTIPSSWSIKWTAPYQSQEGCQTVQSTTQREDDPKNNTERNWTVFYKDGDKINSVLRDNKTTFTKRGMWQADQAVYIEDGVQAVDCPSVIRFSTYDNKWAYMPMAKASTANNASDQYKTLMNKAFGTPESDVQCTPTDKDSLGLFKRFGLPESYYDRGTINRNNLQTSFGFSGANLYGAELLGGVPGKEAQGIGANGEYANGAGIGNGGGVNGGTAGGGEGSDDAQPTCTVEGIGWIVCPVMTFMAGLNDKLYTFISYFLDIKPAIFGTDPSKDLYGAWSVFRGYANVLFIVAFLIIVYSQITSVGITNYGIKKLLPKLIIAAILVNISYYICQIAVDISNILGYGLKALFDSIGAGIGGNAANGYVVNFGAVEVVGGVLAATAGVALLALAISVPVILGAILVLGSVALILIARQAIVILLIAISPIAFVAWLLPNTTKWFKKWWDLLFAMLMLYPIISLLFGAGKLAGDILGGITIPADTTGYAVKLAALAAMFIPLSLLLPILQNSLKAAGALGAKLNGWSTKATGRVGSKVKTDSRLGRGWNAALNNREKKRHISQDRRNAGNVLTRGAFGVLGGRNYNRQLQANAVRDERAEYEEVVKAATDMQSANMNHNEILNAASLGNHNGRTLTEHERDAAIRYAMASGSFTERRAVLHRAHGMTRDQRRSAVSGARAKGDGEIYGQQTLGMIENNQDATGRAYGSPAEVETALNTATTQRLEDGSIAVPTMAKDAHTAEYVAARAHDSAAAETQTRLEVRNYSTVNPQDWAAINSQVRGHLGGI